MQGREPTDAAVMVMIDCRFTPPASWPKYKREAAIKTGWQTAKNDVDNLAKSILDGATGIIWDDDSQVVGLVVTKRYDVDSKTLVTVIEPDKNRSPIWTVAHMMRNFKFLEAGIK
jgi:Holliday junction resolvase RusA-like endonuclease